MLGESSRRRTPDSGITRVICCGGLASVLRAVRLAEDVRRRALLPADAKLREATAAGAQERL